MKKIALGLIIFLYSFYVIAGTCENGSLVGPYNYEFTGTQAYQTPSGVLSFSKHDVGRINFNGLGAVTISGIETIGGTSYSVSATSTYSVTPGCIASGTFNINANNTPVTFQYWIYLDQMSNPALPGVRVAYHATLVISNDKGESGSGTMTRVVGKFQ
jgi:hypothetical protein